jgi:hypothetical protein
MANWSPMTPIEANHCQLGPTRANLGQFWKSGQVGAIQANPGQYGTIGANHSSHRKSKSLGAVVRAKRSHRKLYGIMFAVVSNTRLSFHE